MIRLGFDAKLYYKVGGVADPGPWVLAENVRDVNLNLGSAEADVTTRRMASWRITLPTLREASVEFEMIADDEDTAFRAFRNAFFRLNTLLRNVIGLAIMSGAIDEPKSEGLQADFAVSTFGRNEALEEGQKISVTGKPTYSLTPPAWVVVPTPPPPPPP